MTGPMMDRLLPIALVGTERSPGLRALLREAPAPLTGLMQALWSVALSDGTRNADEDTLIRLVASLLGVTDRDSALARQAIERPGA